MMQGNPITQVLSGDEARNKLAEGIKVIAGAVKSTLGPGGRPAFLQSQFHTQGMTITKDGVTVAKSITLNDPVMQMAVRTIREAAVKTVTQAGDGTTTSIVLAEAIIKAANEVMGPEHNAIEVARHIKSITDHIVAALEEEKIDITDELIKHVATVSTNNDEELGEIIADTFKAVGEGGVVTVGESKTFETYAEVTKGIRFERGLMSNVHMTDATKDICELDDPLILVTDIKIKTFGQIQDMMEAVVKHIKKPLLIIGDLDMAAQQVFNKNVYNGVFKGAYVHMPDFGWRREEMMEDLAIALGAKLFSQKMGNDLSLMNPLQDLGTAQKVRIGRTDTTIVQESNELSEAVEDRVADIRKQLKDEQQPDFIDACRARIAMLEGNAAIIYVGSPSDIEKKEKRDRVDDAVLATQAAIDHGVLPGGGTVLLDKYPVPMPDESDVNCVAAAEIMSRAIKEPFCQILRNTGKDEDFINDRVENMPRGTGYNARTGQEGNMFDMGIVDPAKVTIQSLKNAGSVARTILTTDTVVSHVRDES